MQHSFFFFIIVVIIKVFDFVTTFIDVLVSWIKGPTLTLNFWEANRCIWNQSEVSTSSPEGMRRRRWKREILFWQSIIRC